jgi:hypothetical protein
MPFINLTPHAITIRIPDGDMVIPPSPPPARVNMPPSVPEGCIGDVPIDRRSTVGTVDDLPEYQPGTYLIVSLVVLAALEADGVYRDDVFAPGTGPTDNAIRENGQVVAVTRLIGLPR